MLFEMAILFTLNLAFNNYLVTGLTDKALNFSSFVIFLAAVFLITFFEQLYLKLFEFQQLIFELLLFLKQ